MIWIIFAIIVIVYFIYSLNKDKQDYVQANITDFGGMESVYKVLIEFLISYTSSRITKITKDSIEISSQKITFYIDCVGPNTEVTLYAILPLVGKTTKKWKYPLDFPQDKIIHEIENYLEGEFSKMKGIVKNDVYKYINTKD